MRTIAIVLGDNDFGKTFKSLLTSIFNAIDYNGDMNRDSITKLIHEGIMFHYMAYQHRYDLHSQVLEYNFDGVSKYLSCIKILFDDDAAEDIQNVDHDGGAWYLELDGGCVYSY